MTDVIVIPMSSGEFVLQVQKGRGSTDHEVDVPARLLDAVGLPRDRARELVVHAVEWVRDRRSDDIPPRLDLGTFWDEEPDFRRYLVEELQLDPASPTPPRST